MPDNLKASRVTPRGKGWDPAHPSNFLHFTCLHRIFEKLVYSQVSTHLEKCDILNKFQFSFHKRQSTEQAIVEISDNLKKAINNNFYTCQVFLGFAKTFASVNHQIILKKLETHGIRAIP